MQYFAFGIALAIAFLGSVKSAEAMPQFAHDYGFTCQKCHGVIPQLNTFGQAFLQGGYRLPTLAPDRVLPLSIRFNFLYTGDSDQSGLPKQVLDELELLSAGAISDRTSYFLEQYVLDGGRPGSTRDAWMSFRLFGT